ncbi:hypothetical protein [Sulfurovum sp.]|uniref:hypothetical protein n=1 Tax=Sulfurovum sp. TaxID=1969726 RepID=UPI0025CE5EBC|nr:hypothetical protein [Sulfurovum sp.]
MTALRTLFDDTFAMVNIVSTPEQADTAFRNTCREFFSYVRPVFFIPQGTYDAILEAINVNTVCGFKDTSNLFGLDVGSFEVSEMVQLDDCVGIRVKPLDYDTFKLDDGYTGAFCYIAEYMGKKVEKNNMNMLKSAGIDNGDGFEIEDISVIRDYLKKEFGITAVGLVM